MQVQAETASATESPISLIDRKELTAQYPEVKAQRVSEGSRIQSKRVGVVVRNDSTLFIDNDFCAIFVEKWTMTCVVISRRQEKAYQDADSETQSICTLYACATHRLGPYDEMSRVFTFVISWFESQNTVYILRSVLTSLGFEGSILIVWVSLNYMQSECHCEWWCGNDLEYSFPFYFFMYEAKQDMCQPWWQTEL